MRNVFKKGIPHNQFVWENIGDIEMGRGELGETMPVIVYRLMQHTLLNTISMCEGPYNANVYFRKAGFIAGFEFAKHILNLENDLGQFTDELQQKLQLMNVGIYRVEIFDPKSNDVILTVGEELGGVPATEGTICKYEEGFVAGITDAYFGTLYHVREAQTPASEDTILSDRGTAMKNIFLKDIPHKDFTWENLGDIEGGRGELGVAMPVLVYRLMQYTMLDVLTKDLGADRANDYFRRAGFLAGTEFANNMLDLKVGLDEFVANLQMKLQKLRIGILRMEAFDQETGDLVMTVAEDLDCSGLPVTNETVCNYDEGFIAGILEAYTGKRYEVREVDCWANGDRVCRFNGKAL